MSALVLALATLVGTGLSADVPDEAWITVDREVLLAFETGGEAGYEALAGIEDPLGTQNDVIAVPMTEERILELTEFVHRHYRRCGGFAWHASREEAYEAAAQAARAEDLAQVPAPVPYTIDNPSVANAMVAAVQETEIRSTIESLSAFFTRYHNCQTGADSANWIRNKWAAYAAGRADTTLQLFPHTGYTTLQPSVILTIQGTTVPSEVVVLGGHQDSIAGTNCATSRSPGADDDASGIATITEVLRVAMQLGFRPERTVKFMAYAAEEVGLRGSAQIAQAHRDQNVNVVGVLQFDMTNYSDTPQDDIVFFNDFTTPAQNEFIKQLAASYPPSAGTMVVRPTSQCGYGCSDHASWFNRGYVASFPFEARFGDHSPFIHSQNDTLAMSGGNANRSVPFARLGAAYLAELAKGALVPLQPATR